VTRVAAVDIGTNSTRLLVADVDEGRIADVERDTNITRLGEGVDERRRLLPVPIARVRNVLTEYRRTIEALGAERTLAIATSAIRDAENGEAFLGEIEWSYGFATRLLSGHEEALMTYRGVTSERRLEAGTVIIDIGGGSTEFIAGEPDGVRWHDSLDIGSVRLTERFLRGDPPTAAELDACAAAVRALLTDRVHGSRLTAVQLSEQLNRLAAVPLAERRTFRPLDPDRAPVIVAGAVIAREALAFFALDALEISERDILDGASLAAAELPEAEEGPAPPGAYTCC
jgi:exopolyphosphatase/guanosine-5'-triphosphate,3'-diphosphate pyrophosphatase